jgi:hypothetical protein
MDRIDVAYIIEYRILSFLTNCHKWNVLVRKKYNKLFQIIKRIKSSRTKKKRMKVFSIKNEHEEEEKRDF